MSGWIKLPRAQLLLCLYNPVNANCISLMEQRGLRRKPNLQMGGRDWWELGEKGGTVGSDADLSYIVLKSFFFTGLGDKCVIKGNMLV